MKQFGVYLANLRSNSTLSLSELASLVGSSRSGISRLETDRISRPFKGKIREQLFNLAEILCTSTKETERYLELADIERTLLTETEEIQLGFPSSYIFQSKVTITDLEQAKCIYAQHIEHLIALDENLQAVLKLRPHNTNIRQHLQQKIQRDKNLLETIQHRLGRLHLREQSRGSNISPTLLISDKVATQSTPDNLTIPPNHIDSPMFDDKRIEFFEEHVLVLWQLYQIGGTSHVDRYFKTWFRELEIFVKSFQGHEWHERALAVFCMSYLLQGTLASDKMLYEQAYNTYQQALAIAIEINDAELTASALTRIGGLLVLEERFTEAIPFFSSALDNISGLNLRNLKGTILEILAEIYVRTRQHHTGQHYIDLAENILGNQPQIQERGQFLFDSATLLARQATIAILMGDFRQSISLIDKSLAFYQPTSIRAQARLLAQKAETYRVLGELDACTMNAEKSLILASSVGSSKNIARIRKLYLALKESSWSKESGVNQLGTLLSLY